MKKILLPTDGSELGNYAYDLAHRIAQPTEAEIHVICIVPAPAEAVFDSKGNIKDDEGEDLHELEDRQVNWQKKLDDWVSDKPDITQAKVKIGRVDEDILRYVEEESIDLVVMGTSGAVGWQEWTRGSHAQHLANQSPVPILSLKCDRSGYEIKDLLLVSNFQEEGVVNLEVFKIMQQAFSAKIHLLRINTARDFQSNREVTKHMQVFSETNGLQDVAYHVYCDETVEKGIANFSAETGIDFVAIGTHQRTSVSKLFKHSVSDDVINHIWAPVLVFPV